MTTYFGEIPLGWRSKPSLSQDQPPIRSSTHIPYGHGGSMPPRLRSLYATERTFKTTKIEATWKDIVQDKFPIIKTFSTYTLQQFMYDSIAGFVMGIQILPKSLGYARLAGVPSEKGVYVAFIASILYPICGASDFVYTGPEPIICLLIKSLTQSKNINYSMTAFQKGNPECSAADIADHATGECHHIYTEFQTERQSLIGIIGVFASFFLIMGNLMDFGFISNFISKPITDGFVCSAGCIIFLRQMYWCMNLTCIVMEDKLYNNLYQFVSCLPAFMNEFTSRHLVSCALSITTLAILFGFDRFAPAVPTDILVIVLGIGFSKFANDNGYDWIFGDEHHQTPLIGEFDLMFSWRQFGFKWPGITWNTDAVPIFDFKHLPKGKQISVYKAAFHGFVVAITLYFVGIVISRLIAKRRGSLTVRCSHEMLGLGVANLGAVICGGFSCGHGFDNSLHVLHSGAQTRVWSIICGIVIIVFSQISYTTTMLAMLPKVVLCCIIIHTIIPVITFESKHSVRWMVTGDCAQFIITMFVCFLYGLEKGIIAGICVAVLQMMYSTTGHGVAELGRLPNQAEYRNVDSHPEALVSSRILIARLRDSLLYTNWYPVEEKLETMIDKHIKMMDGEHLVGVVINLVQCGSVDSTAAFGLLDFCHKYAKQGVAIRFSAVVDEVTDRLTRVGIKKIPDLGIPYRFYVNDHSAIRDIIENHVAVHDAGSVHLSEVESPKTGEH